jgi:hypothetical protein
MPRFSRDQARFYRANGQRFTVPNYIPREPARQQSKVSLMTFGRHLVSQLIFLPREPRPVD